MGDRAHAADIGALKKAFADGLDIHAMTASEMFGVPLQGMPGEVRRRAKAINFGTIYGISAFGLAAQFGIPREASRPSAPLAGLSDWRILPRGRRGDQPAGERRPLWLNGPPLPC